MRHIKPLPATSLAAALRTAASDNSPLPPATQTLHCLPIAHVDHMRPEKLGQAALVEEVDVS